MSSCKVPVILVIFYCSLNFLGRFSIKAEISSSIKIRPVGAKLFHADGRTDRHEEANSRCSQFYDCAQKLRKNTSIFMM